VLNRMAKLFVKGDELLKSVGMVTLYYLLLTKDPPRALQRQDLLAFEAARRTNRVTAEEDIGKGDYELLEFDRFTQSPNDEIAMEYRLKVIRKFLAENK